MCYNWIRRKGGIRRFYHTGFRKRWFFVRSTICCRSCLFIVELTTSLQFFNLHISILLWPLNLVYFTSCEQALERSLVLRWNWRALMRSNYLFHVSLSYFKAWMKFDANMMNISSSPIDWWTQMMLQTAAKKSIEVGNIQVSREGSIIPIHCSARLTFASAAVPSTESLQLVQDESDVVR